MTKDEAFNALVSLAREINPRLPADIDGFTLAITASIHGCHASAVRLEPPAVRLKRDFMESDGHGPCYGPSSVGG
jgi:hypothetical protein